MFIDHHQVIRCNNNMNHMTVQQNMIHDQCPAALTHNEPKQGRGWMPKFRSASARWGDISLDIPLYRTIGGQILWVPAVRPRAGVVER